MLLDSVQCMPPNTECAMQPFLQQCALPVWPIMSCSVLFAFLISPIIGDTCLVGNISIPTLNEELKRLLLQ